MNGSYRAGLSILAVLSLGDAAAPLYTDGVSPPLSIALIGSGLGLISLVLVALAWGGRKSAAVGLVVLRLLSALTAVPAFVLDGVPAFPMALAGVLVAGTLAGVTLVLAGMRRPAVVTAP